MYTGCILVRAWQFLVVVAHDDYDDDECSVARPLMHGQLAGDTILWRASDLHHLRQSQQLHCDAATAAAAPLTLIILLRAREAHRRRQIFSGRHVISIVTRAECVTRVRGHRA